MEVALIGLVLTIITAVPLVAWAQAAASLPTNLPVYVWFALFAMLGGVVSFSRKVRAGMTRWLNINELLGEMVTSGFVGVITGLLLTAINAPATVTFAAAGIAGHMGGRAIFWLEQAAQKFAEKRFGIKIDMPPDPDPVATAAKVVADAQAMAVIAAAAADTLAKATANTSAALDPDKTLPPKGQ